MTAFEEQMLVNQVAIMRALIELPIENRHAIRNRIRESESMLEAARNARAAKAYTHTTTG